MKWDSKEQRWYEYGKLSDGKTAVIIFDRYWRNEIDSSADYYVSFAIANKKKTINQWMNDTGNGDLDLKITGSGSTEGLVWAYKNIQYFIEEVMRNVDRIIIQGSDNRRFKIYEHFLKRLDFKKIRDPYWGMCLKYEKV